MKGACVGSLQDAANLSAVGNPHPRPSTTAAAQANPVPQGRVAGRPRHAV